MKVYRELSPFLVLESDTVRDALAKIESNKRKIVFVVDEKSCLVGSFADGDFRRWSLQESAIDLSEAIGPICNLSCASMHIESSSRDVEDSLKQHFIAIPLVDDFGHVVALAERGSNFVTIENRRISDEDPVFVIAEIGNNHQGSLDMAKCLIDAAVEGGADCAKFQMRTMSDLYGAQVSSASPEQGLGSQYALELLEKYQLSDEELFSAFDYCASRGITPLCTPWDCESLDKLERYGMQGYKIASADLTNFNLLAAAAETAKPLICSTGMSSEDEIRQANEFLEKHKASFIFLHCNSTYPTPYKDINLGYLKKLKEITRGVVGYSGHERGTSVVLAAVSLGAKVVEKHLTLDRGLEGNDHSVSILPDELSRMVREIRTVEESLGSPDFRQVSQGEMVNREVLAKSLYSTRNILEEDTIRESDVVVRGPGTGIQPNRLEELVGKKARRKIPMGGVFFESDINPGCQKRGSYKFARPVGIPVRYHDYQKLCRDVSLDFVEFHLSYKDLEVDIEEYVGGVQDLGFMVHAPELFSNDHLLDLASLDKKYRERSIAEMKRVIDHVELLKTLFPGTEKPVLVLNSGGWNAHGFDDDATRSRKYLLVEDSLSKIDLSGVELAIQTMPPFPWHFGGQSHHNIFVTSGDISEFCKRTGYRICLDISHTMMACNYYDVDLLDYIVEIAPYVIHMHIVDAKGCDGEGVQIGRGDVDFKRLGVVLDAYLPDVPFIPEVWQGHNDEGAGFWEALDFLERRFQ